MSRSSATVSGGLAAHSHSGTQDPFSRVLESPTGSQPVARKKKSWKRAGVSGARLDVAHSTPSHIHRPEPSLRAPSDCLAVGAGRMKPGCVPDKSEQDVVSAGRLNRAPPGWVLWWEAEWNHVAREGGESEA